MRKTSKIYPKILVALGSNLPNGEASPIENIQGAISLLLDSSLIVEKLSGFYETPCFPNGAGPDYVNAAAVLCGDLSPVETLKLFHAIEEELGRKRKSRWGQRTVDIDLLAYGEQILPDLNTFNSWKNLSIENQIANTPDQLILPHPRIQDRGFVLVPLAEIAPEWRHPVIGKTVEQMKDALSSEELVEIRLIN